MSSLTTTPASLPAWTKYHVEVPPGNVTCPKCGEGTGIQYSWYEDSLTCAKCGKEAHVSEFNLAPQREAFENYEERRIDDFVENSPISVYGGGFDSPTYRHRLKHPTHQEQVRLKELGSGQ